MPSSSRVAAATVAGVHNGRELSLRAKNQETVQDTLVTTRRLFKASCGRCLETCCRHGAGTSTG